MPYKTEWVSPEVFMEHDGVTVYHIYRNDNIDEGVRDYWFSTSIDGSDEGPTTWTGTFDVRALADELGFTVADLNMNHPEIRKSVIRTGIERGVIRSTDSEVDAR